MYRKFFLITMLIGLVALVVTGCSDNSGTSTPTDNSMSDEPSIDTGDFNAYVEKAVESEDYNPEKDLAAVRKGGYFKINYISGPTTITESGIYRVTDDFTATENGIVIRADHVILLLGKHTITGPGNKMGNGVMLDGARFVLVFGGKLEMFGVGVMFDHTMHSSARYVEIMGGDEFADPANGVAPQVGIMFKNSAFNLLAANKLHLINLGIFVRGGDSHNNKLYFNKVMGGDMGLLGICYNPIPGEGDAGPHKDFVYQNYLDRFRTGIQTSSGSMRNRFVGNTIKYFNEAYHDYNGSNIFRNNDTMQIEGPDTDNLTLNFEGLTDLGPDYVYEGWIIVDGAPVSTGTFTVDGDGHLSQTEFPVASSDLMNAVKFVLTIEPADDPDPAPSMTHYLAGDFSGDMASLSVADMAALGNDFSSAMGQFILNTPSTGSNDDDYSAGIWWLDPSGGPDPTLMLPTLPDGWAYEGWVVGEGGPVTTGKFLDVAAADFDGAGPTSGPDGFPPFPGQDYIDPLMSLIGYAAVITIEPMPDNSPAPFALKPLVDMNIEDVGIGVLQSMNNNVGSFPTGSASR